MELPFERIGPYVRALGSGLNALVPSDDYVPLRAALAHLAALDPALSDELLLPAEHSEHTGMPSFTWMERVISEAALARSRAERDDPTDDDLARAKLLDAALGRRMAARRALYRYLRGVELLPVTRLSAAVRRRSEQHDEVSLRYDRMAPDGRWLRLRAELRIPAGARGPLRVSTDGHLRVDDSMQHLLTRHFATPLGVLGAQLVEVTGGRVLRLGRAWVGPFWFPGVQLPPEVPAALGSGLLLHLSQEVIGADIAEDAHLDPLALDTIDLPHEGLRSFRERRFAGTANVLSELRRWLQEQRIRTIVVEIGRRGRAL